MRKKTFIHEKSGAQIKRFEQIKNTQEVALTRLESLLHAIGRKPKWIKLEYNGPTLWTTISLLIDEFEKGFGVKIHDAIVQGTALVQALVEKNWEESGRKSLIL